MHEGERHRSWWAPALRATLAATLILSTDAEAALAGEWKIDDVLLAEIAEQFELSDDGGSVVWVKRRMDEDRGAYGSQLFVSRLADLSTVQLTRGKSRDRLPRWSPHDRYIAFLSDRDLPESDGKKSDDDKGDVQLWVLDTRGGEPWPLTEGERSIRDFAWLDGGTLVVERQEDPSHAEERRRKGKDKARVVDDEEHEPRVRLYRLEVESRRQQPLTANDDWIDEFAVSPDGRWLVARHQTNLTYEYDQRRPPELRLTDLRNGESTTIVSGGELVPSDLHWAREAGGFYFRDAHSSHPQYRQATVDRLYYYDLESRRPHEVALDWPAGLGDAWEVIAGGVLALLADGVHMRLVELRKTGAATWQRGDVESAHQGKVFDLAAGRGPEPSVVFEVSSAAEPIQWFTSRLVDGALEEERQLTTLNSGYADKPRPRREILHWRGAEDAEVEGILYYPFDYEEGQRYPLIVKIHGGPSSADLDDWGQTWSNPVVLLLERGALVLEVNYHGSANYGLEWVESIGGGRYYELEIPDIEAGVDHVIGMGLADPDRLATMGWSNGAILSTELVTRTGRYKSATVGAGDVEWISDWANVDFGAAFDNYYFGASPLEDPQRYIEKSPFFRLGEVTTPTLIFFGTEDRNVPTSQGWSHFRALQQIGRTPVRFVLFPGEAHGLTKLGHQRRKLEEELSWIDQHLLGRDPEPRPVLAKGSPLDRALAHRELAAVDGRYGVLLDGVLAPELVTVGELELGRLEVTRAQFAAFDSGVVVASGRENHPISGIGVEQARAYCEWLSEATGERFRLPREAEVGRLYESPSGRQNTLDYWAGYDPNPEDAEAVRRRAATLPGEAPLLLPAGYFADEKSRSAPLDMGGNVAEWVEADDGEGKLLGGSADRVEGSPEPASPEYAGFRVLRESD